MGLIIGDLSKPILEEDVPFFIDLLGLIAHHQTKADECEEDIAAFDKTHKMLDYLKRTTNVSNKQATSHLMAIMETSTQRQIANQQLVHHMVCHEIFQQQLYKFLISKYRVHKGNVEEWQVDIENREIFRRVKVTTPETEQPSGVALSESNA